jgi:hypothetical protein
MAAGLDSRLRSLLARLGATSVLVAAAALLILLWANTRVLTVRAYQSPTKPTVPSAYYVYHGIAIALEDGKIGQLDLARYRAHLGGGDVFAEYPRAAAGASPEFVHYYALDVGYAFVVELGRLLFPVLPDNYLRVLALQLFVDLASVAFVYYLFSRWSAVLGLAAACGYTANAVFVRLVAVPLYYYWDVPICFAVLGSLLFALEDPRRARLLLFGAGALLGFAVWLRASWWPLSFVFFAACAAWRPLRSKLLPGLAVFGLLAVPLVARASFARGSLTLSTRATWHVALVGLGYYPNAYGFELNDEHVFDLTREKYGVVPRTEDYGPHDEAARREFMAILRRDPGFLARSFLGRLWESALGTTSTSARPYVGVPNPIHRLLCLLGLIAMHRQGGPRRLLAWVAAAFFVTYVALTSLFYFVGLAYDNVSQVSLFILLMGLLDAGINAVAGERAVVGEDSPS